jgi:hypothetical protein
MLHEYAALSCGMSMNIKMKMDTDTDKDMDNITQSGNRHMDWKWARTPKQPL